MGNPSTLTRCQVVEHKHDVIYKQTRGWDEAYQRMVHLDLSFNLLKLYSFVYRFGRMNENKKKNALYVRFIYHDISNVNRIYAYNLVEDKI